MLHIDKDILSWYAVGVSYRFGDVTILQCDDCEIAHYFAVEVNMDKTRVNLMLDEDVIELLDTLAGGERKRGLYISQLIRTTHAAQRDNADVRTMDVESLRLVVLGLAGRVKSVEGEIVKMQAKG